jgi:hypothetical protein
LGAKLAALDALYRPPFHHADLQLPIYPIEYSDFHLIGSAAMAHREAVTGLPGQQPIPEPQYQCACCEGIIEVLSDQAIPSGLDLKLGFISDECVLVCNTCTLRLIGANKARSVDRRS